MAEELSRIYGTELDRHGEKCDRRHNRPTESPTVLFPNMLQLLPTRFSTSNEVVLNKEEMETFDEFYEDIFVELSKTGEIEDLIISGNPGLHLNGNVYVKFRNEKMAAAVLTVCNGRLYDGRPLRGELSLVTEFGEARCRQYANGECDRKMCNFLHLAEPSRQLKYQLFSWQAHKIRSKAVDERRHKKREHRSDSFGRNVRHSDDWRRDEDDDWRRGDDDSGGGRRPDDNVRRRSDDDIRRRTDDRRSRSRTDHERDFDVHP